MLFNLTLTLQICTLIQKHLKEQKREGGGGSTQVGLCC